MPKTAFVLGATGAIGRKLVNFLVDSGEFSRVVLLGRRPVDNLPASKILEQKIVDFNNIDKHSEDFKNLDIGFCALGTTRGQSGADGFVKIEHDYVVNSAKVARENGVKEFVLVSARGVKEDTNILYYRTKARAENECAAMGFEKTLIVRPAFLEGRDADFRWVELVAKIFYRPLKIFSPNIAVHCNDVAKAMIVGALDPELKGKVIFENADLPKKAAEFMSSNQN